MSQVSLSAQYLASARPSGAAPPSSSGTPRPVPNSSGNLSQASARPPYRPNINVPKRSNDDVFARTKVPQTPTTSSSQVGNDSISGSGAEKKKKEDSLRGTMRNEIAKLMYGAGDVADPDIDTVDYMEDMVVEFLSDLCRPVPPIRSNPSQPHQPVPLSGEVVRHRLATTPMLHKYLARFDHMVHMADVLKAHRRVADPSLKDLVDQVGNDYLGLNEHGVPTGTGDAGAAGAGGVGRQKRPADGEGEDAPKKKGRPPKPPGERKKPGPQKGWKLNRDPNAPPVKKPPRDPNAPKRKYVRKAPLKSQMGTPTASGGA
ncbi:hypothetical protein D1P53_004885 [Cryptococcus gattii VGV]|nr:hypothetical protein D1P53_004885 [Cryptococcus gattii VGV]